MMPEGVAVVRGHKEVKSGRSEEGFDLLEVVFHGEAPPGLGALCISIEKGVPYVCRCLREVDSYLGVRGKADDTVTVWGGDNNWE